MSWQNDDGVYIRYGLERAAVKDSGVTTKEVLRYLVVDLSVVKGLPTFTADLNNNGTNNGFAGDDAYIPAGSYITKATIVVTTAFATSDSATLDIGLAQLAGTVIDVDGIDDAIAVGALNAANKVVLCNGALAGQALGVGANDAYVYTTQNTGTFSAGAAKLVIEYITV